MHKKSEGQPAYSFTRCSLVYETSQGTDSSLFIDKKKKANYICIFTPAPAMQGQSYPHVLYSTPN
jgi:hypothetical protein